MIHSRLSVCSILLFFFLSTALFSQEEKILRAKNRGVLKKTEFYLEANGHAVDSVFDQLIGIWNNPATDDSVRVEIAYLVLRFPYSKGLQLLIDNVETSFSYGSGASGIDQFNTDVCSGILAAISSDKNRRWSLIHPILNALKDKNRPEGFIREMSHRLSVISSKSIAKSILEIELEDARHTIINLRNYTYENNLVAMLKQFE